MNVTLLGAVIDKNDFNALNALIIAAIGMVIVFAVLIALMFIISLMGKIFDGSEKVKQKHPEWGEKINGIKAKVQFWKKEQVVQQESAPQQVASGTCGELKLINTEERDAAMIMAIVADSTGTPLNELRFKSIKRIDVEGEDK